MTLLIVIEDKLYKGFNNPNIITFEQNESFKNVLNNQLSNYIAISKSNYAKHKEEIEKDFFKNRLSKVVHINKLFELNRFIKQEYLI